MNYIDIAARWIDLHMMILLKCDFNNRDENVKKQNQIVPFMFERSQNTTKYQNRITMKIFIFVSEPF